MTTDVGQKNDIVIFDTTMRDGEQSPGATMTKQEKLLIADVLDKMGVSVIEAGFAIASKGDLEAIQAVAKQAENAVICSLARAKKGDIEAAAEAIAPAKRGRIHTFISTSPIHMKYQINMTEDQVLEAIKDSVSYARNLCDDVEWSGMDATRSDIDFLCKAVEVAIDAGASTVNIPDTVGYALPQEFYNTITTIRNSVPNIDKAIISVHCHNDLGLAVANSLAAINAGAGQVECTINGLGERAGNASLEEIVMALKTRSEAFNCDLTFDSTFITRASKLVSTITGFAVQKNKAIVGANAFAHESGIHQDGVLKNAATYEIMTPESVGLTKSDLVMGKHSGRHAFRSKLQDLGINLGDNAFEEAFARFKELGDKKKNVYDEDIIALMDDSTSDSSKEAVIFKKLIINCGSEGVQKASISVEIEGTLHESEQQGDGPVDATFKAIKALVPTDAVLELYQVHGITGGTDAQAEVTVRLKKDERIYSGNARDTDTIVASAKAYIAALNKVQRSVNRAEQQKCDELP
ncbi:MAG: 2-isopropylmalate synthase [Rickettsiales bacterium]|nr:2-isopropylmalate synthase [Rickettsiales bacterium]